MISASLDYAAGLIAAALVEDVDPIVPLSAASCAEVDPGHFLDSAGGRPS